MKIRELLFLGLIAMAAATNLQPVAGQSIGLNFTGSSLNDSGFFPPDTMGTVGSDHIVEMINGRYAVYDKTSGAQLTASSLDSFWVNTGMRVNRSTFDPRVQYDPFTSRFYAASVNRARSTRSNILFAVSDTSNPLDGWTGFTIDGDTDNLQWADFPQMGFSSDSIVISNNMFDIDSGAPLEINTLVIPKADILGGSPTIAGATLLESQRSATGFAFSLQSAIDLDNSGRPLRLFSSSGPASQLSTIQIDGLPNAPVINNIADVTGLTAYYSPPRANQPGNIADLDSGGDRTRSALTLINNSYYGIRGAKDPVSGNAALQWYQLNADTLAVEAEGLLADSDLDFIYGSISANQFGDIVIGFTGSSENQFASAYAAVGTTDINGNILFDDPMLLQAGVANYERMSGTRNRWGDYSATVLDPDDPYHFWTFQEFASGSNQWSIQITEIIVESVPEPSGMLIGMMCFTGMILKRHQF